MFMIEGTRMIKQVASAQGKSGDLTALPKQKTVKPPIRLPYH